MNENRSTSSTANNIEDIISKIEPNDIDSKSPNQENIPELIARNVSQKTSEQIT